MKNIVAQITQPIPVVPYTPPAPPTSSINIELALTFLGGVLTVLGIPQIVKLFATERVKNNDAERKRDDRFYEAVFTTLDNASKNQNGNSVALVAEISLMREVVMNNTEIMRRVGDTSTALVEEIHQMRIAGSELKLEVRTLRAEVKDLSTKYEV